MPDENGDNLSLAKEIEGRSFWLFDRSGKFRAVCRDLATSPRFERVVLTAIFGTCVLLALDRPALSAGSPELFTIFIIEAVINSFYVFEISVKCVAHTFVGFVSAGYNPIDFFVTVTSALDTTLTLILVPKSIFGHDELDTEVCSSSNRISMSSPLALNPIESVKLKSILKPFYLSQVQKPVFALELLRFLRVLRALRPLRLIERSKGLRLLMDTVLSAVTFASLVTKKDVSKGSSVVSLCLA